MCDGPAAVGNPERSVTFMEVIWYTH